MRRFLHVHGQNSCYFGFIFTWSPDLSAKHPKSHFKGYATDLLDAAAITATVDKIKKDLGSVTALLWNPYGSFADLRKGSPKAFADAQTLAVNNLLHTVQLILPDLEANKGAILVTGGGLALENEGSVKTGNAWGVANLAVAKAAQRKLVHLMNNGGLGKLVDSK